MPLKDPVSFRFPDHNFAWIYLLPCVLRALPISSTSSHPHIRSQKSFGHEDGSFLGFSAVSLVKLHRRFRYAYCLYQGDELGGRMSVYFCQTARRNSPEDIHLHIRRRKDLKAHPRVLIFVCESHVFRAVREARF